MSDQADQIVLKASQYSETDMKGLKEEGGIVWTQDEGSISYDFNVAEAGLYYIQLTYYTDVSSTQTILRNVYVNGEIPFDDCEDISIDRLWVDDNKNWLMNTKGNQAAPTQVQEQGPGQAYIDSNDSDTVGNYMFYFQKGKNTVTLESKQSILGIGEIALVPASELLSYDKYLTLYREEKDAEIISANNVADGAQPGESPVFWCDRRTVTPLEGRSDGSSFLPEYLEILEKGGWTSAWADTLGMIISEEAASYFSGDKTAEAAAEVIQRRAQIYLNE